MAPVYLSWSTATETQHVCIVPLPAMNTDILRPIGRAGISAKNYTANRLDDLPR